MKQLLLKIASALALVFTLLSCQSEIVKINTSSGAIEIPSEEFLEIVVEAYFYGYPLVLMDYTKKVSTNIESPDPMHPFAPVNQIGHFRVFPDHNLTTVVKPNVDTYYSIVWFNLREEPQVLSMPATERYYLLPFMDAYSNVFASPGTRTTGTKAQDILLAGPKWKGEIPEGLQLIQAPSESVWMLGRIQVNSPEDGSTTVRDIQDKMRLVPLSAFGKKEYASPKGTFETENANILPVKELRNLDIKAYFDKVLHLMKENPPSAKDSLIVNKMERIGLIPGNKAQLHSDSFIINKKLQVLPEFIHKKMEDQRANPNPNLIFNGWTFIYENIGTYGTDYKRRAFIDFIGLGANIPEDTVYPNLTYDINGNPLDAGTDYQIHFEADKLPPVDAFWSLTAYNKNEFLVKNDLNRFALGDRDDLIYNKDGSLDLYIQSSPTAKEKLTNWLPVPETGPFYLTLRLYWPKEKVLKGNWNPPLVLPSKQDKQ